MRITLDWLGCATFRLCVDDDLVVFLDAYMDRVPSAPPVGLSAAEVDRADFILVGHSHFDHIAGAEVIARNTGAKVIGSHESCRVMRDQEVEPAQLLASQGGERHRLAPGVTVRVLPSLHSCIWSAASLDSVEPAVGQLGLCEEERAQSSRRIAAAARASGGADTPEAKAMRAHRATACGSASTGGALAFLIETPAGSIFYQDTSGCWSGILRDLRPDVAILAAAGRGNIDGEPIQGALSQFVAHEAALLQPRLIIPGHHDNWMPPLTQDGGTDLRPIAETLARVVPAATLLQPGYREGTVVLER